VSGAVQLQVEKLPLKNRGNHQESSWSVEISGSIPAENREEKNRRKKVKGKSLPVQSSVVSGQSGCNSTWCMKNQICSVRPW
jgi:hypothetical protein